MFGQKEYHVRRLGSAHALVKDFGDFSFALMHSLIASFVLHLIAKAIPITKKRRTPRSHLIWCSKSVKIRPCGPLVSKPATRQIARPRELESPRH